MKCLDLENRSRRQNLHLVGIKEGAEGGNIIGFLTIMMGSFKMLEENNVQFVTWNSKGLNGAVKRGNILAHLRKLGADVAFLQETHLKNHTHKQLNKNWVGRVSLKI